jgi:hypothetical protein
MRHPNREKRCLRREKRVKTTEGMKGQTATPSIRFGLQRAPFSRLCIISKRNQRCDDAVPRPRIIAIDSTLVILVTEKTPAKDYCSKLTLGGKQLLSPRGSDAP